MNAQLQILYQVIGGDPLLKLLAVDWFTADNNIDGVALDPKCLVQVKIHFFLWTLNSNNGHLGQVL